MNQEKEEAEPYVLPPFPWNKKTSEAALEVRKSSKLSVERFAQHHGVAAHRLSYWENKFRSDSIKKDELPEMLAVNLLGTQASSLPRPAGGFIELTGRGGCTVRLHGAVELVQLSAVLKICGVLL